MSIRERLLDARLLYANGHYSGALLTSLVAVAATSRKRYPQPTRDSVAFTSFAASARGWIACGVDAQQGAVQMFYRGKLWGIEDVLYSFMRCELAHEGALPADVRFVPGIPGSLTFGLKDGGILFSYHLLDNLALAVMNAKENAALFTEEEKRSSFITLLR
jgi:hypothetical protein